MIDMLLKIAAGGLFAWLALYVAVWHHREKAARIEAELAAKRRIWEREVERAGRRMLEEDERRRIIEGNKKSRLKVTLKGDAVKFAEAWE